jgi:hypothetical protein
LVAITNWAEEELVAYDEITQITTEAWTADETDHP